jgi:hypothetical protein
MLGADIFALTGQLSELSRNLKAMNEENFL